MTRDLPAQFPDEATKKAVEASSVVLTSSTSTVMLSNVVAKFFMSTSLQYVWDLVNTQQLIMLIPLMNVRIPANTQVILEKLTRICAFEVIPTD